MYLFYENILDRFDFRQGYAQTYPPHIHQDFECFLVKSGSFSMHAGGQEYDLHEGDFVMIFPGIIHSYQVDPKDPAEADYLIVSPTYTGMYLETLKSVCPKDPVLRKGVVSKDILYAFRRLAETWDDNALGSSDDPLDKQDAAALTMLRRALVQLILAQCIPLFEMVDKDTLPSEDILYRTIRYLSGHYREPITLTSVATALGYSPYTLSRVISKTLQMNFNEYVNNLRLDYASGRLRRTRDPITDICFDAGFESQRTFNRAFQNRFHKTPRQFRGEE